MRKVFVTGGCGFVGSLLIPELLKNYIVTVYDCMYFGNSFMPVDEKLNLITGDIRDTKLLKESLKDHDYFIHLACISNDTSFELDEKLSTTVNLEAFEPMVIAAKESGIKRFIYASTSSVYGISKEKNVTEDHPLVPLTLYNKYKGMCEPILFKHTNDDFNGVIFRPATVCGYAPRLRLDLSVNILTTHAIVNNCIKVFGGEQLRPNLHIKDYCRVVELLLEADNKLIENEIFNVGYQNASILEIAKTVKQTVSEFFKDKKEIKLEITPSNDKRSYHINSDKIKNTLGFIPNLSIEDAVIDLCEAYSKNKISDPFNNSIYYNVETVKNSDILKV